jgi:hypothetical protein
MVVLIRYRKSIQQNATSFHDNYEQISYERKEFQHNKGHI